MFKLEELKMIVKDLERIANNCDSDNFTIKFAKSIDDIFIIIDWASGERDTISLNEIKE